MLIGESFARRRKAAPRGELFSFMALVFDSKGLQDSMEELDHSDEELYGPQPYLRGRDFLEFVEYRKPDPVASDNLIPISERRKNRGQKE